MTETRRHFYGSLRALLDSAGLQRNCFVDAHSNVPRTSKASKKSKNMRKRGKDLHCPEALRFLSWAAKLCCRTGVLWSMGKRINIRNVVIAMAFMASTIAAAAADEQPSYLAVGAGYAGILRGPTAWVENVEYRWHQQYWAGISPKVVIGLAHGARYYNASLYRNWRVGDKWRITIASGPGIFERDLSAQDLGSHIEILSGIEVSRDFHRGQRLGLAFQHISNAHLGRINPGSEVLQFTYQIPIH